MSGTWPSWPTQVMTQARAQTLVFRRTPIAAFFTLVLPLVMLVVFNALFDGTVDTELGPLKVSQFYTAGLAAFTAVSATYTNLVNLIPMRRDDGILKRARSTPLQPSAYVAGVVASAVFIAVVGAVLMLGLGVLFYDLQVDAAKMPAAITIFVVSITSFSLLGLAMASVVPNAASAPAAANATILPLAFVSNIFVPLEDPPRWLDVIGDVFPLKHFAEGFQAAFNPFVDGAAFRWTDLGVIAAWGAVGAVVAVSKFNWEPSVGSPRRGRRRGRSSREIAA